MSEEKKQATKSEWAVGTVGVVGLGLIGGSFAKAFKEKYPDKTIWAWTGFQFDKDLKDKEVMKYIDVLVDGQYKDELHNPILKWKGSSNQRVIDVKQSLEKHEVIQIN